MTHEARVLGFGGARRGGGGVLRCCQFGRFCGGESEPKTLVLRPLSGICGAPRVSTLLVKPLGLLEVIVRPKSAKNIRGSVQKRQSGKW